MNRLNGWQRIWVVLTVLWGIPVVVLGIASVPTSIYHFSESMDAGVVAHMSIRKWDMTGCPSAGVWNNDPDWNAVRNYRGSKGLSIVTSRYVDDAGNPIHTVRYVPLPDGTNVTLCFGPKVSDEETARIGRDYLAAYARRLRMDKLKHAGMFLLGWLAPAAALYVFGMAFAWIRRGFQQPKPPAQQPTA